MSNFTVTTTNKGKTCLVYKNNKFRKVRNTAKDISWRCTVRECAATLYTNLNVTEIIRTSNDHQNHEDCSDGALQKYIVKNTCKRKAEEDISMRPRKLICAEISRHSNNEMMYNDVDNIRLAIYRARRKTLPTIPKSREEVFSQLRAMRIETNRSELFCHVFDDIVILTCATNLKMLVERGKVILIDGTFYTSPRFFSQLYIIHSFNDGVYNQLVYCFLPEKTQAIYLKMWNYIRQLAGNNLFISQEFRPEIVLVDFEIAAHEAVMKFFGDSIILKGCGFHLGQSWYRKIIKCGLSSLYQERCEEGEWLKLFFGLPYLQPMEVEEAFLQLMAIVPRNSSAVIDFSDYVLKTYIEEGCKFPPHLWAEIPSHNPRTTNGAESFHRHLKDNFYSPYPNVHLCIDVLNKIQSTTYLKLSHTSKTKKKDRRVQSREQFLIDRRVEFDNNQLTMLEYLKIICRRNLPASI